MTVLSQHTSDVNTARAFAGLKARFPEWDSVVRASPKRVADAIRSGGLADQKAPRIQAILREIARREGRLSLDRLRDVDDDEVEDYLCSLPGVGPKTAACVLVFSLGRAAFPIDTHVHRVTKRLGWIPENASAEGAHAVLKHVVPADVRYELHVQLIAHGRTICKARMPLCTECPLLDLCPAGPRLLAEGLAR
ncbi:MAG TPA: endonuclease III [Actinomycetota bacterium]|nr:endonuclease III [Actinomycetota bacterium]